MTPRPVKAKAAVKMGKLILDGKEYNCPAVSDQFSRLMGREYIGGPSRPCPRNRRTK